MTAEKNNLHILLDKPGNINRMVEFLYSSILFGYHYFLFHTNIFFAFFPTVST